MKVKIDEAFRIYQKYGFEEVPILFLNDVYVQAVQIGQGTRFDDEQYEVLKTNNIKEIEVIYSEKLFTKLVMNFPASYRIPVGRRSIIELDRVIDVLESANAVSKRKRAVVSLSEIYKKNARGLFEPILRYGEKLTFKRWNEVKMNLSRTQQIDYRFDECGIIILFLTSPEHPQYAQKYMKFTEIVSMIVESKDSSDVSIAQDFNPHEDVYTVTDKHELMQVYNDKKAALVIVADELGDDYKRLLAQLKAFDKYARMMVVMNPAAANKRDILLKIKNVYGKNLWEED